MKLLLVLGAMLLSSCASHKVDAPTVIQEPVVTDSPHSSQPSDSSLVDKLYYESLYENLEPGMTIGHINPMFVEGATTRPFYMFAWYPKAGDAAWDNALLKAVAELDWSGIESVCLKLNTADCAAQLLSIMAKYESDFNPKALYHETGDLAGVISRGLLQISQASANQKAYACGIKNAKDLHDPIVNLKCAVKILHYQAKKTGKLIDGTKYAGCGVYWAVCRKFKVDKKTGKLVEKTSYKGINEYITRH